MQTFLFKKKIMFIVVMNLNLFSTRGNCFSMRVIIIVLDCIVLGDFRHIVDTCYFCFTPLVFRFLFGHKIPVPLPLPASFCSNACYDMWQECVSVSVCNLYLVTRALQLT